MTDERFATNAPLPLSGDGITDGDVLEAMQILGGSFVANYARLYQRADAVNQAKLRAAFTEYWSEYRQLVALKRQRVTS